ncbi:adenine DNA glycosylase [Thalassobacillus devorans]|uniref:Adenine DNA glycosylase n=1 Tax=Thalassobacillus devorans TaxID=279813 RepID=A0ABQ1PRR0_9BACI|nr:A/G-specific adenine glycosylase [Thalassobacillus devorans]NIK30509.1 A/G-specific adenine glycosylase [Thalassobacillus devorans]GGD02351.1 adenine DNA glycosylase [Thalassobacillus devorans]
MKNKQARINGILSGFNRKEFQHDLINWFKQEQRTLPWRDNQDPYRVWVSEIMLQQTKVDTVIPYFQRFIEKFPTPERLAEADEQEVLKAWEGLGYYSRARNLQNAIREVVSDYGGKVPDEADELGSLKGVGPYTKGAILSIAYDKPEPAVDGNVMRVMSRILYLEDDIAKQGTKKLFESLIREVISTEDPSSFNQGLMELGALVCTPKSPSCMLCPVQDHCRAFHEGVEQELPIKTKTKKQKRVPYAAMIVINDQGEVLIQQRPADGLLANLWEFPMVPLADIDRSHLVHWFYGEYGINIKPGGSLDKIKHVFSHLIWELEVIPGAIEAGELDHPRARFVSLEELESYPFPVSHQKIAKHVH